jgi:hypothetical protein
VYCASSLSATPNYPLRYIQSKYHTYFRLHYACYMTRQFHTPWFIQAILNKSSLFYIFTLYFWFANIIFSSAPRNWPLRVRCSLASYSGGSEFKSRPDDRLSSLAFHVIRPALPGNSRTVLQLGNVPFRQHAFQLITYYSSYNSAPYNFIHSETSWQQNVTT